MDKTAIRAVVAGTVAYDTLRGQATWFEMPSEVEGKVPGVYVIGMSREGQQGQFLNMSETQRLIDGLESGKVRQIQSPLYVDCSTNLRARTSAYKRTARRGLVNVNKPLCLVLNTIEALSLSVDLTVRVTLRIWEADQLPLAEQLITTLAFSLVHQCGFNATEAGGTGSSTVNPTSASLRKSTELIMAHSNTMEQNLRATLAGLEQRRKFLDDLDRIGDRFKALGKAAREATPKEEFFSGRSYEEVKQIMAAKKQKLRDRLDQLRRENQQMELLNNILAIRARRKVPSVNKLLEEEGEDPDVQPPLPTGSTDAENERGADVTYTRGWTVMPEGLEGENSPRSARRCHAVPIPPLGTGSDKALTQAPSPPGGLRPPRKISQACQIPDTAIGRRPMGLQKTPPFQR
ncbi:hypothetical protein NCS55_01269100 [Fusarium keratoplasticum]|nr:hypothetical protein NCS55_01269100 [Fusarium keratoplasticum]